MEVEAAHAALVLQGLVEGLLAARDHQQEEARLRPAVRRLGVPPRCVDASRAGRAGRIRLARSGPSAVHRRAAAATLAGASGLLRRDGLDPDDARAVAAVARA